MSGERGKIFAMAWPAALESLLVGIVDLVDMAMVSSLGLTAVASVGVTAQPKRILLMFILALNVGATALVSRRIGEKRLDEANQCMRQFVLVCAILSLILYGTGALFAVPFMRFCGANDETLTDAVIYFRILAAGQLLQAVSLTINACLRAAGKTRVAFTTNLTANIVNLIFNYLLIFGKFGFPRWGVAGAATATSLGSAAALLISLWSVRKSAGGILCLQIDRNFWHLQLRQLSSVKKVTLSAFQEQFCQRLGLFLFTRLAASLGTVEFALYQFIMNLANLQGYTYDGFATTATALTGQGLGAGDADYAQRSTRYSAVDGYITAAVIAICFALFRSQILGFFTQEAPVIAAGGPLLLIVAASCIPCSGATVYAGALRGAGDTKSVARITLFIVAALRPFSAWLLCYPMGLGQLGIWLAFGLAHTLRWIALYFRYRTGRWRQIHI